MGIYTDRVIPALTDLSMRSKRLRPYRERVISVAQGRVLEIGIGSGLNLPLYGSEVRQVIGLDPSPRLLHRTRRRLPAARPEVVLIEGSAEEIPLESGKFDTVVSTWTACSIPDIGAALMEMRRVLKPSGRLIFVEHGRAPEASVQRWQDRLSPLWQKVSGGCHLNRPVDSLLQASGFRIVQLETGYMPGPRIMTFIYEGHATPR